MRPVVVVAFALLSGCGSCSKKEPPRETEAAAPAAPAKDTPGARYREAVARARGHEVRAEWQPAAAAYREALAIVPGSPRALDALAHSLLGAGDLPGALAAAEEAIAHAADTRTLATAYLGRARVLVAMGDEAGAARDARRTHDLFPRGESRALLEQVGSKPAGYFSPLPAEGPFADLAALCKQRTPPPPPPGWVCDADKGSDIGVNKVEPVDGPFAEARLFEAGTPERSDCVLAMRTGKTWWAHELRVGCRAAGVTLVSKDLAVAKPNNEPPHLLVRSEVTARWTQVDSDGAELAFEDLDAAITMCGVGPSKAPSCTPAVPIGSRRTTRKDGGAPETAEFKLDIGWGTSGLTIGSKEPGKLDRAHRELLGVHPIRWR
jgi:hypothetical protein